jgi:hypothetical protein
MYEGCTLFQRFGSSLHCVLIGGHCIQIIPISGYAGHYGIPDPDVSTADSIPYSSLAGIMLAA